MSTEMKKLAHSVTILIVDDDPGHCELIARNLRRAGISNDFKVLHSGADALDFVFRRGGDCTPPSDGELVILLDLNMPGALNGIDVLREIKAHPTYRTIPIIILTTSEDPREIDLCYELGCNVYITKPVDPSRFIDAVNPLGLFVSIVRLPHDPRD
jgi:CheY-like chemotaxis protein